MKHRAVFSAPDLSTAQTALAAARAHGIADEDLSLIARRDIELEAIPDDKIDASTDFVPAAIRGAVGGGGVGLIAGLVAVTIPPLGVTLAGAALLTAIGAMVGTWSSALMGSAIPNETRRVFEDEIDSGRILVVVDAEQETLSAVAPAIERSGVKPLPFEGLSSTL